MRRPLVYVADDEPALLALMRDVLDHAGYDVVTAPEGEALLAHVARRLPDAILLDIAMPGMTGWDVQARLQDDPRARGVPVVAVTAQAGAPTGGPSLAELGFAGYLRKPFPLADLLDTVHRVVGDGPAAGEDPELRPFVPGARGQRPGPR